MKLYELTEQHKALEALAENSDEDITQALADTFEALEGEFEEKALSLIYVANNMDADIDALDAEIQRLERRKKVFVTRKESLRDYLRFNMESSGITKIDCPLFTITLRKPSKIALINDIDMLPTDYISIKTSITPVKAAILKALKSGELVPGAELGESKASLIIK